VSIFDISPTHRELHGSKGIVKEKYIKLWREPLWDMIDFKKTWFEIIKPVLQDVDIVPNLKTKLPAKMNSSLKKYQQYFPDISEAFKTFLIIVNALIRQTKPENDQHIKIPSAVVSVNRKVLEHSRGSKQSKINMSDEKKPFLSIDEAAEYLDLKKATLYSYTSRKIIPFRKVRRKIYFDRNELNNFVLKKENKILSNDEIEQKAIQLTKNQFSKKSTT